jgi:hypothetical protein
MGDLVRDSSAIQSKGGDKLAYKRVLADGSDKNPADSWHDFPFQAKLKHEFKQPEKPVTDRSGNQVATELDDFTIELALTSLQDDAKLEEFLKDEVQNDYFAIFSNNGKGETGKTKERFYAITKIERSYSSEEPGRRPEVKIFPQKNENAVTPQTVPSWAKGAANDFAVSAEKYYSVVETE